MLRLVHKRVFKLRAEILIIVLFNLNLFNAALACSYRNGDKFVVHQITVVENIFNFNAVHRFDNVTGLKPYFLGNAAGEHGFDFSRQMRHLRKNY